MTIYIEYIQILVKYEYVMYLCTVNNKPKY